MDSEQKFEWKCPRPNCKKVIVGFTERGVRLLSEMHVYQHMREDRETKVTQTKEEPKPAPEPTAIQKFEERNYDILKLTRVDLGFLKTRGIKLDENIQLDKEDTDAK